MNLSKRLRIYYQQALAFCRKKENWPYIAFFIILFSIFYINAFHESYPDEYDNVLGGWYLLHGIPIYRGFFSHHGAIPYFLSAFIELFGGRSFIHYRIIFAVLLFISSAGSYSYIRRQFGEKRSLFYLIFVGLVALAGNYFWLHMVLADTLAAYFLIPVAGLLFLRSYYNSVLTRRDIIIISLLTSLAFLTSLTFIYFIILIYIYTLYLYLKNGKVKIFSRSLFVSLIIFAIPYFVFLLYLLVTRSIGDYIYEAIIFNQRYYIYTNYGTNPIRIAIGILNTFYNNYFGLLQQVGSLNINFPVNITMAVGSFALLVYLFIKKKYSLALFLFLLLGFANTRSNPLTSKETDYQSAVYILLAFFSTAFLLVRIFHDLSKLDELAKKIVGAVLLVIVGFYSVFSLGFLTEKFFNRSYAKYMGRESLIYDWPELAPILNKLISKTDPIWVGPFEFKELFYMNGVQASRYQMFLPGMGSSPEIQAQMISDFERTKPKLVYFQKNFFILGRSPETYGKFLIDYLNEHYYTLQTYIKDGVTYKSSLQITQEVDLDARLYIRKENADEEIQKLLDINYIHEGTE